MGVKTSGEHAYEADAEKEFDSAVEKSGLFYNEREIWGHILTDRKMIGTKRIRIDRLLIPKHCLVGLGWEHGPIGVELKRSNEKLGRPMSQVFDYQNALYMVPKLLYSRISPKMFFIFPLEKCHGEIASIMAQHWIGSACCVRGASYEKLRFFFGEKVVLDIDLRNPENPNFMKVLTGMKYGSR